MTAITGPPAETSNLQAACNRYIEYLDASPRTIQTYTCGVRQFIKWTQRNEIRQPTRADILRYRAELQERCAPATVQSYITALRLFFEWTAQTGIYPNIAQHIKGARLDTTFKRDYLAAEQIKIILGDIDTTTARGKRDFCIISLMTTGGLRDIEVSRANIADLRGTRLFLQGKGRSEKTDFIKIVPAVERPLREYLKTRRPATGPLFTSLSNNNRGQRLSPRSISSIVKERFKAAGYDSERLTAHSLRHTAVTLSLLGGLPIEEVQQFARHRSVNTTLLYAHHLERENNRSEETIASSIFDGRPI